MHALNASKQDSMQARQKLGHQSHSVSLNGNYQSSKSGLIIVGNSDDNDNQMQFYPQ